MILDTVGAPYVQKNCEALAMDGKIVMIGWMGGMNLKEFDLMIVVKKRISIIGARRHPSRFIVRLLSVSTCHSAPRCPGAQIYAHRRRPRPARAC